MWRNVHFFGIWRIEQELYNEEIDDKNLVDKYAAGASFVPPYIPSDGGSYKVPGSTYMTVEETRKLLSSDLQEAEVFINGYE